MTKGQGWWRLRHYVAAISWICAFLVNRKEENLKNYARTSRFLSSSLVTQPCRAAGKCSHVSWTWVGTGSLNQIRVGKIKGTSPEENNIQRNVSGNRNRETAEGLDLNDKRYCQTTSAALTEKTPNVHIDHLYCRNAAVASSMIRDI